MVGVGRNGRNELFENRLLELFFKLNRSSDSIRAATFQQIVLSALISKAISHSEIALRLVGCNALPESMIILRASYEALMRALYLTENPHKLEQYEAFSEITILRNQLEILKILDESGDAYEGREEQMEKIKAQKAKIVSSGFHNVCKIDEAKLSSWDELKKVTNKSNLPSFEDIRKSLKRTAIVEALLETGFQVYNVGSQMTHSNLEMVTGMVYFERRHPLLTEHAAYQQILLLVMGCSQSLLALNCLSETKFKELEADYQRVASEFLRA